DIDALRANGIPEYLRGVLTGVDPLHNGKGHFSSIIDRIRQWAKSSEGKIFDDNKFHILLEKEVKRCHISDLDGAHFRLLAVKWKSVIDPAFVCSEEDSRRRGVRIVLSGWTEIQWILYSPPEVRQFRGVRLRLHVLLFRHLIVTHEVFRDRRIAKKKIAKRTAGQVDQILEKDDAIDL